jgi:hypothetical protein
LESEENDHRQQAENQHGSHVASATTGGAASLRLEIWILKFGQRKLPVFIERPQGFARLCLW